jgi:hypothetical protein
MNLGRIVAALRRHPLVADVTLAVALAALAAVTGLALVTPRAQVAPPARPVVVAWAAALAAPLVLRRRWPLVVLAVTTALHPLLGGRAGERDRLVGDLGRGRLQRRRLR